MTLKNLIFDIDGTLYPSTQFDLMPAIWKEIYDYMCEHLNIDYQTAVLMARDYAQQHGTIFAGLMIEHGLNLEGKKWCIDYTLFKPNPLLRDTLNALPEKKIAFTNMFTDYAEHVLECLDVRNCFDGLMSGTDLSITPKPQQLAFHKMAEKFDVHLNESAFFEDTARNLKTAKQLGMKTVLCYTDTTEFTDFIDFTTANLTHDLPSLAEDLRK